MTTKTRELPAPAGALYYRTWNRGSLIYQAYTVSDADSGTLEGNDPGLQYLGFIVDIRISSLANWAVPHKVGSASLWGIEANAPGAYFTEIEEGLIRAAEEDLRLTFLAMRYAVPEIDRA
jgi:hypothetical protein